MAPAVAVSPSTWPQSSRGRFVVKMMEPFSYLFMTTSRRSNMLRLGHQVRFVGLLSSGLESWTMVMPGGKGARMGPGVHGDRFAISVDPDQMVVPVDFNLLSYQSRRVGRVEGPFHLDVTVGMDDSRASLKEAKGTCRQRLKCRPRFHRGGCRPASWWCRECVAWLSSCSNASERRPAPRYC